MNVLTKLLFKDLFASEQPHLTGFEVNELNELLLEFARKVAIINVDKLKDYCSDESYNLIVAWLSTGNEKISDTVKEIVDGLDKAASAPDFEISDARYAISAVVSVIGGFSPLAVAHNAAFYSALSSAEYGELSEELDKLNGVLEAMININSACDNCTAYPFYERGKTPLCKTCEDNPNK